MPKKRIAVIPSQKYRLQGKAAVDFYSAWDKLSLHSIAHSIPGLQFKDGPSGKLLCKCVFHDDENESAVILPASGAGPATYFCSTCGSASLFEVYAHTLHMENGGAASLYAVEEFHLPSTLAVVGNKNPTLHSGGEGGKSAGSNSGSGGNSGNNGNGPPYDYTVDHKLKSGYIDPALTEERVDEMHEDLLTNEDLLDFIESEKGWKLPTIKEHKIGLFDRGKGDKRFVIPIRDLDGKLINYRMYSGKKTPKYLGLDNLKADGLFPHKVNPNPEKGPIIIVEGESDALCGLSIGLNVYTGTAGAGTWKKEWDSPFQDLDIGICYDNDQAGINGSIAIAERLQGVAKSIRLMKALSNRPKGDLCDFVILEGKTAKDVVERYNATPIFSGDVSLLESFVDVEFEQLANLKPNTRVRTKFKIFQIENQFGFVSSRIKVDCKRGTKKICNDCPAESQDEFIVPINPQTLDYMQTHLVASDYSHLRRLLRLNCSEMTAEFDNRYRLYKTSIYPPDAPFSPIKHIEDAVIVADDHLDMINPVMFDAQVEIGQFPRAGAGKSVKHQTWFVFKPTAIPSIEESFSISDEIEYLLPFQVKKPGFTEIQAKLNDIYSDLESKLAIMGRKDLICAADLCFLSAKEIHLKSGIFTEKFKGVLEVAFFGATRTGKTSAVDRLSKLYKSGKIYDCANLTHAALIGMARNEKDGGGKFSPGILPKADGDLIILDEADKTPNEDKFAKLTATRSSGVAKYNKRDQSFALPARVRIIWLANPPGGRSMENYSFPFEVFLDVMKQSAAVSRFDFAISITSKEFRKQVIHDLNKYQLDSYQKLLLFSRHLSPEKIEITQGAIDVANESAKSLFEAFGRDKGPVSNDIEEKLLRIGTAIAIRVFAYDTFKEKLVVSDDHVQMAVHLMQTLHSSNDVQYDKMFALERDLVTEMRDRDLFFSAIEFIPDNDSRALFCQTVEENIGMAEFDRDDLLNIFPKKDYINGGHFFEKMLNSGAVYAKVNREDGRTTKTRYKFSRDGMLYVSVIRELGLESKEKVHARVIELKDEVPVQQEMGMSV